MVIVSDVCPFGAAWIENEAQIGSALINVTSAIIILITKTVCSIWCFWYDTDFSVCLWYYPKERSHVVYTLQTNTPHLNGFCPEMEFTTCVLCAKPSTMQIMQRDVCASL